MSERVQNNKFSQFFIVISKQLQKRCLFNFNATWYYM